MALLTGVLSMSELLEDQIAGPLNDRQLYYLLNICAASHRSQAAAKGQAITLPPATPPPETALVA